MKDLSYLDKYRIPLFGEMGDAFNGVFLIPAPNNYELKVIASSEMDWDHVSVSLKNRCPNWPEMSYIKHMFFGKDETCYQLHVPSKDHINFQENCLHIWRPHNIEIPIPPKMMV